MTLKDTTKISKFISLILRHKPEKIGIELDANGWASVNKLISGINRTSKIVLTLEDLKHIVSTDNKSRYAFNEDGTKIRASQGHSVDIKLEAPEQEPKHPLYHGTVKKFIDAITKDGLRKMNRQYVHLSDNIETAIKVGERRGQPVILVIDAQQMYKNNHKFFLSDNGVWLTDRVPTKYIYELKKL